MSRASTYKPKHLKKRGPDSTPRGPERWERAAVNAFTNPTSHGAQLYFDRVATAREFLDFEEAKRPFEHFEVRYHGQSDIVLSTRRLYVTCNMFCAAMQVQLDHGTTEYAEVLSVFEQTRRRTYKMADGREFKLVVQTNVRLLDIDTLKRATRCQVCGTKVSKS